jgi:hypothetical protein
MKKNSDDFNFLLDNAFYFQTFSLLNLDKLILFSISQEIPRPFFFHVYLVTMSSNSEVVLTHSQAACAFYGQDITPENELLNEAKIDSN